MPPALKSPLSRPQWFRVIPLLEIMCGLATRPNPTRCERVISMCARSVFCYYVLWELLYLCVSLLSFARAVSLVDKVRRLGPAHTIE